MAPDHGRLLPPAAQPVCGERSVCPGSPPPPQRDPHPPCAAAFSPPGGRHSVGLFPARAPRVCLSVCHESPSGLDGGPSLHASHRHCHKLDAVPVPSAARCRLSLRPEASPPRPVDWNQPPGSSILPVPISLRRTPRLRDTGTCPRVLAWLSAGCGGPGRPRERTVWAPGNDTRERTVWAPWRPGELGWAGSR